MLKSSIGCSLLLFFMAFSPFSSMGLFANPISSKDIVLVGHSRHHGHHGDGHHGHGGHHEGGHHGHGGGHHGHGHH